MDPRQGSRYSLAENWSFAQLATALPEALRLVRLERRRARVRFLDSFDWRLHEAGLRLWLEEDSGRSLHCVAGDGPVVVVPVTAAPQSTAELPAGFVRDTVAPLLDVRALMIVGELELERDQAVVRDAEGDTACRLSLEIMRVLDREERRGAEQRFLVVESMPGQDQLAARLRGVIQEVAISPPPDALALACAVRGREPGDYSSKPRLELAFEETAAGAAQRLLESLRQTIERNVPGILQDIDVEFLHDFRVAVRRSRSLITELRSVLDRELLEPHLAELKWLGGLTGELRDLDVYLLEMDHYRMLLPASERDALDGLERTLRRARSRARQRVCRGLRSRRFKRFASAWEQAIAAGWPATESSSDHGRPVIEVAGRRILKAHRRLLKRGRRVVAQDSPAAALHRLRIDAKKLRYLLELFRSLYENRDVGARIKELKALQDILGGFNDMEVQRMQMGEFAEQALAAGHADAQTLLAMGRLQEILQARQEMFRHRFATSFRDFDHPGAMAEYRRMCGEAGS